MLYNWLSLIGGVRYKGTLTVEFSFHDENMMASRCVSLRHITFQTGSEPQGS